MFLEKKKRRLPCTKLWQAWEIDKTSRTVEHQKFQNPTKGKDYYQLTPHTWSRDPHFYIGHLSDVSYNLSLKHLGLWVPFPCLRKNFMKLLWPWIMALGVTWIHVPRPWLLRFASEYTISCYIWGGNCLFPVNFEDFVLIN